MDENHYRSTYAEINPIKCAFEKAINSRVCNCSKSSRFNLADREGVACDSNASHAYCQQLLVLLRDKARFVLQQTQVDGPLPHNAEIKIQCGGVKGLIELLKGRHLKQINAAEDDVYAVIQQALVEFNELNALPFSEIMQQVTAYQGRKRRGKK